LAKILKGKVLRGEIRWADLSVGQGHETGERPVLIISHDIFNERSGTAIVLALTSQEQRVGFPLAHELLQTKLPKRSWVKISQIRTLSVARLGRKLGSIAPEEMDYIVDGLNEIVG
jgi:mRNA interferase MazF